MIQDKGNCLFIDARDAAYALTYIGSIKGMRSLIETSSKYFYHLKISLLKGLITRYCRNFASGRNETTVRLNKLIGIYAENIGNLELPEEIPMIIDDEFINELMDCRKHGFIDSKDILRIVSSLISRKSPSINRAPYEIEEGQKLS